MKLAALIGGSPRRAATPVIILLALFFITAPARAQVATGAIYGSVGHWNPSERAGVIARLRELATSTSIQEVVPNDTGGFVFRDIPFATYDVEIAGEKGVMDARRIEVPSAVPVTVRFDELPQYTLGGITVEESAAGLTGGVGSTSSRSFYTDATIADIPAPTANKSIEAVLLATPGVVPDEDGRLHVRGEDAMLQYVIDGIPVTANLTRVFSSLFNAGLIRSMDVTTGGLAAQYGVATSAVSVINTKSGFDRPFFAGAKALGGTFNTKEGSLELGGNMGGKSAYYVAGSASSSDRYLDPVAEGEPNHAGGETRNLFGKVNALLGSGTDVELLGMYDRTKFEVPNQLVKTPAQDQRMDLDDYMIAGRITSDLSPSSVLGGVLYTRRQHAKITSGGLMQILTPGDSAKAVAENEHFFIGGDRSLTNTGGQIDLSSRTDWFGVPNEFRAGVGGEVYPVNEFFTFAVTNPAISDPDTVGGDDRYLPYDITQGGTPFLVDQSKTGNRESAFVQDEIRAGRWTVAAGVRFDVFKLLETESAFSPRLGASYAVSEFLTLRGSYDRIVMQAPLENYLVSSSDEAKALTAEEQGTVPTVVRSEKAHSFELGGTYKAGRLVDLDLAVYGKMIDDFIVKVELGNSGVIFPANLKNGLVAGAELRARLREWNGLSGYLSVAGGVSQGLVPEDGSSPFAAGLVLGEEGEAYTNPWAGEDQFPTEHNQLLTAAFGITWRHAAGFRATFSGRFDSGLPFDLTGPNGEALDEEGSRQELLRRGYSEDVIALLELKPETAGSPDRAVAPHAVFDVSAGYDLAKISGVPVSVGVSVLNVFDTAYLYKFESTFGGTHFGVPRMVVGTIGLAL
jgi:hypothetical protein